MELCIIDWNICRVCLREENEGSSLVSPQQYCSVFKKAEENCRDDDNLTIAELLMACSKIIISKNQNLPNKMCQSCIDDLYVTYRFHKNCEHSNTILSAIVPASSDTKFKTDDALEEETDESSKELNVVKTEEFKYDDNNSEDDNDDTTFDYDIEIEDLNDKEILTKIENDKRIGEKVTGSDKDEDNIAKAVVNVVLKAVPKMIVNVPKDQSTKATKSTLNANQPKRQYKKKTKDKKDFGCCICGNKQKSAKDLEIHIKRHTNNKQFMCSECGKAFVSNSELVCHNRIHTGQRPYQCKYCSKRFASFSTRVNHERTHTGERPYFCEICHKSFAYSCVLSNHMLTHTGEKRYVCPKCGRKCTKAHHLKNHLATHAKHEAMESEGIKRRNVPSLMNNTDKTIEFG